MAITDLLDAASSTQLELHFLAPAPLYASTRVRSFRGREAMNELFSFDIVLSSELLQDAAIDFETTLLGQDAALLIHSVDEPPRLVRGIISAVELEGAAGSLGEATMRVRLVPGLWLLSQRRRTRIFQQSSVPEVVGRVLGQWGLVHRWDMVEKLGRRTYCTQYEETDYQFVARLLAEEGIFFYFDAGAKIAEKAASWLCGLGVVSGGLSVDCCREVLKAPEQIVFCDHAAAYRALPSRGGDAEARPWPNLYLRSQAHSLADDCASVGALALCRELAPKSVALTGYDFRAPRLEPRGRASVFDEREAAPEARPLAVPARLPQKELEVRAHEGFARHEAEPSHAPADDAKAGKALAELRREAYLARGTSRNWRLLPGHGFRLIGHAFDRADHDYVVTCVEHRGEMSESVTGPEAVVYSNTFSCAPGEVAFRPPFICKPVVRGPETALVEGSGEEDIHVDEHGRIKVRFYWDLEPSRSGEASCWLRVAQSWAGAGFGQQFLPRAQSEVVVTFLRGDPDNPLVTGCVYNGGNPTPFVLPSDKTRSGIRTISTPGGRGYNELSFEDRAGAEQVLLRAERDLTEEINNDHAMRVGRDRSLRVQGACSEIYETNRKEQVFGHLVSEARLGRRENTLGDHQVSVGGARQETLEQGESRYLGSDQTINVEGGRSLWVSGFLSTLVGTSEEPSETLTSVFGKHTTFATGSVRVVSEEEMIFQCGDSKLVIGLEGVRIESKKVAIVAKEALELTADGPMLTMEQELEIAASAVKVYAEGASLELSSTADLNGDKVNLNCGGGSAKEKDEEEEEAKTKPIKLQAHDPNREPFADKHYRLIIEGEKYEGVTDGDGYLNEEIPEAAKVGQLTIWIDEYPTGTRLNWPIEIGEDPFAPASEIEGALLRLRSLGYYTAEPTPTLTPGAMAALRRFQADNGLAVTGELDDETAAKLEELHGV